MPQTGADALRSQAAAMQESSRQIGKWVKAAVGLAVLGGLYLTSLYSYLLFHSLAEGFSIFVACAIFIIAWNSRRFCDNNFFLFLGIAYLFVGAVDLVHTLAYTGMGVFPGATTNLPTQLWVSARYLESASLLAALLLIRRKTRAYALFSAYLVIFVLLLCAIFWWDVFPVCFIEGKGLTPFKKTSEYVISGVFAAAILLLVKNRKLFDKKVLQLTAWSLLVSIGSELSFTLYVHAYGLPNLVGHFLKIISFYLIYRAIIDTALTKPYALLFRDVKQSQEALKRANDELELRVQARVADLARANEQLIREAQERLKTQKELEDERRRLFSVMQMLPGYVCLMGRDHSIHFANDTFLDLFGQAGNKACYRLFKGRDEPCSPCPAVSILESGLPREWEWTDTNERIFRAWGYPFTETDGTRVALMLGIDITDRKRLQEEVLRASEMERQRVGQDLHDSLGQTLSGASCLSRALHQKLSDTAAPEAQDAEKIESILTDSLNLARSLARGLIPVQRKVAGLMIAMKELASRTESMFHIRCDFQCEQPVFVGDNIVATHLYRIAQEATNNAVRHSKAKCVTIRLALSKGEIVLAVEDDGVGLPENLTGSNGMGLRIMRYRADSIGASIEFLARPEGGTAVTCRLKQTAPTRNRNAQG